MRLRYLLGSIFLLLVLAGCTQADTGEVAITCQSYCEELPHVQCVGYWQISGDYPDCACSWICSTGGSDTVTAGDCTPDWDCSDWSVCQPTSIQTRVCTDLSDCGVDTGKPVESQSCDYTSICEVINDESLRTTCRVITSEDLSYCDEDSYENCLYDLAKINLNKSLCEEINSSVLRNSCKAILNYDYTYCDTLKPSQRDACYGTVNVYLRNRAVSERDYYYCGLINDASSRSFCNNKLDSLDKFNYYSNLSVCELFSFDEEDANSTLINGTYFEIFSCYAYHAVNDNTSPCDELDKVENLTKIFDDECEALYDDDLSYCYDLNGTERDRCYGHFAYARNDYQLCRDTDDRDDCLFIAGKYFDLIDFCTEIFNQTLRNDCIYSVATHCLPYNWRECNSEYCRLIDDDNNLRDTCVYNIVKYDWEHAFVFKTTI